MDVCLIVRFTLSKVFLRVEINIIFEFYTRTGSDFQIDEPIFYILCEEGGRRIRKVKKVLIKSIVLLFRSSRLLEELDYRGLVIDDAFFIISGSRYHCNIYEECAGKHK